MRCARRCALGHVPYAVVVAAVGCASSKAAWCIPCGFRNGVKFEQRYTTTVDEDGAEREWVDQLTFCLAHRDRSELCVYANSKSGIRKKPRQRFRAPLSCPICRKECQSAIRVKHPLLGLPRNYALSKQTNRIREESKLGEDGAVESEDEQPTPAKRSKLAHPPPPPPADSIAVQRGRRGKKKRQREEADQGDEQSPANSTHGTSADEMPLDDVDDSALIASAAPSSFCSSPSSTSSSSSSSPLALAPFPLPSTAASRPFCSAFVATQFPFNGSCVHPRHHSTTFSRQWQVLDKYRHLYDESELSEHEAHAADGDDELDEWLPHFRLAELVDIFEAHGFTQSKSKPSVNTMRHELMLWIRHSLLRTPAELTTKFMTLAQSGSDERQHPQRAERMIVADDNDSGADEKDANVDATASATQSPSMSSSTRRNSTRSAADNYGQHIVGTAKPRQTQNKVNNQPASTRTSSPPSHIKGRRVGPPSPIPPPLVPVPTELCKLADTTSPRRAQQCEQLLADESICAALHAMQNRSEWDSNGIARQYQQDKIEALLTLHGYSCQVNGSPAQPKLMLTTLIRLVHGGMIQTPDELRARCRALRRNWRSAHRAEKERREEEASEQRPADGGTDDGEYSPSGRATRKEKRRHTEDTAPRREGKNTKRLKQRKHMSGDDEDGDNNTLIDVEAEEHASTRSPVLAAHVEESMDAKSGDVDVDDDAISEDTSPPVLPRIHAAVDEGGGVLTADPPANIRRASVLSPTSATSSKSNIPSSQSTFPSSQSSGAVTVQRAISFSSAERSSDSSPSTSFVSPALPPLTSSSSSSSRMTKSKRALLLSLTKSFHRYQRYAEQGDAEVEKEELELIRQLVDGLLEEQ